MGCELFGVAQDGVCAGSGLVELEKLVLEDGAQRPDGLSAEEAAQRHALAGAEQTARLHQSAASMREQIGEEECAYLRRRVKASLRRPRKPLSSTKSDTSVHVTNSVDPEYCDRARASEWEEGGAVRKRRGQQPEWQWSKARKNKSGLCVAGGVR